MTKDLYDSGHSALIKTHSSVETLPELIVKDFDDEQIWQQIELENEGSLESLLAQSAKLLSSKSSCSFKAKPALEETSKLQKKVTNNEKTKGKQKDLVKKIENADNDFTATNKQEIYDDEDNHSFESDDDSLEDSEDSDMKIDENDKFFDFTGDSDEDLNFDFGPLGQKGDIDEQLFDKDESEMSDTEINTQKQGKGIRMDLKKKKSVSFEDDWDSKQDNKKTKKFVKKLEKIGKARQRGSSVDDKFFKLADLETFLEQEDRREERRLKKIENAEKGRKLDDESEDENDDIDMFAEIDSEDEVGFILID